MRPAAKVKRVEVVVKDAAAERELREQVRRQAARLAFLLCLAAAELVVIVALLARRGAG